MYITSLFIPIPAYAYRQTTRALQCLALAVLCATAASAQTVPNLQNTRTKAHQRIGNTKLFIIPPEAFEKAPAFDGFQHTPTGASILAVEIPGPFTEATAGFTESNFKAQGMTLNEKQALTVNGYPGLWLSVHQAAYGITYQKYMLVFGNDTATATAMVSGMYPVDFDSLQQPVIQSLRSAVYLPHLPVDQMAGITFSVNPDGTRLKFSGNMMGMLHYTADGKIPTTAPDKLSFIVGKSLGDILVADKKAAALSRIKKMPANEIVVDQNSIKAVEIDGLPGYEITAHGKSNTDQADLLIYQVMLFPEKGYYLMTGTAEADFKENQVLFEKIARTFMR